MHVLCILQIHAPGWAHLRSYLRAAMRNMMYICVSTHTRVGQSKICKKGYQHTGNTVYRKWRVSLSADRTRHNLKLEHIHRPVKHGPE